MSLIEQLSEFRSAALSEGLLLPEELQITGQVERCPVKGKPEGTDGAYVLMSLGTHLIGYYQNWYSSQEFKVFLDTKNEISEEEKTALDAEIHAFQEKSRLERKRTALKARAKLQDQLSTMGSFDPEHKYVVKKHLGLAKNVFVGEWAQEGKCLGNCLIVPIYSHSNEIISCQAITESGNKYLYKGAPLDDGFYLFGNAVLSTSIVYTESFSNAYSLHAALGVPVCVVFGKNRFNKVIEGFLDKYPNHRHIIAADNDYSAVDVEGNPKNVGVLAAQAVQENYPFIDIVVPPKIEGKKSSDWNDIFGEKGSAEIKSAFSDYVKVSERRLFYSEELEASAPHWVVKGWLEANSLNCMYGPSAVGKSYIAAELACRVASGTPFMGTIPVIQGVVVYILGEGYRGFTRRKLAWKLENPEAKINKLIISKGAFGLSDKAEMERLTAEIDVFIAEIGNPPTLIVVDTLARNFGDGDENSTQDMNKFINAVDEKIRAKYECCVLIVHHTGNDKTRARGSSVLRAALDAELSVSRDTDATDSKIIMLSATKTKDGSQPKMLKMTFKDVPLPGLKDNFGDDVSSSIIELATDTDLTVFIESLIPGQEELRYSDILFACQEFTSFKDLALQFGDLTPRNLEAALTVLNTKGTLEVKDDSYKAKNNIPIIGFF